MTKRPLSSRIPISPGILLVSTIKSGLTRPDRNCTSRSVPPASTLATPEAPARILTASSTLVGAAKLRLGMFAPEIARAHSGGPIHMPAPHNPGLHYHPLRREELCSNASTLIDAATGGSGRLDRPIAQTAPSRSESVGWKEGRRPGAASSLPGSATSPS